MTEHKFTPEVLEFVEVAAARAAQRVAAIHRRRLVTQVFLVAIIMSLVIGLPVALIANHDRAVASSENSQYNCALLTEVGDVLHDFIASDAKLRSDQQNYAERQEVISGFEKIIKSKTLKRLIKRSNRLDRHAQDYWNKHLLPRIAALAKVNCEKTITTNGPKAGV